MSLSKKVVAAMMAVALAGFASSRAYAAPLVTNLTDSGTLLTTIYSPVLQTSNTNVPTPYGSAGLVITPVTSGWKLTFNPTSGFFASANNLPNPTGGKTSILSAKLDFDITFDSAINLTANIFEDGIWSALGGGAVSANRGDLSSGVVITQLSDLDHPSHIGNSFATSAVTSFPSDGTWTLFDKVTGFSTTYAKYHITIDNDLIAEALASQTPEFASIAKKDFSIVITTDGSSGGGPSTPEPASLGVLAIGGMALLARRRK